jgi:hypothetical protein
MKPWYKSKTVWFNVALVGGAAVGGLAGLFPAYRPYMTPEAYAMWTMFVGVINVALRSVTSDAIWHLPEDKE